jgi:hypothetical protein
MAESFVLLVRRTAKVRGLSVAVSAMTIPRSKPDMKNVIEVNGEQHSLVPGNTYVLMKFEPGTV